MYEHAKTPPLSLRRFAMRMAKHVGYGAALVAVSMAVGTFGFMEFAGEQPIDAMLNAAMLLGGMGPVGDLSDARDAGKLFAAGFALYAGLVFLLLAALLITPMLHRVLHRFHWEQGQRGEKES